MMEIAAAHFLHIVTFDHVLPTDATFAAAFMVISHVDVNI